ncbi:MAG: discoidin domain-containing protein [Eubacterium sp.]|nr:discoidin domain-containing protein [Eubacterium sp.]
MSRSIKKTIAVLCALAMVVAGIVYTPATNAVADDYSDLEFKVSDNNPDMAIAFVTQGGVTTSQEVNYCLDQGTNFYCATTAAFTKPNFKTVTCNGNVEDPARAGANFWIPVSVLNDDAYNLVTIEDAVGNTSQFVIRMGTPSETTTVAPTTVEPQPTTEAPTGETTEAPTEATTEAPSEWTALPDGTTKVIGDYSLYAGMWGQGAISYKGTDNASLQVRIDSASGDNNWGIQFKYPNQKAYASCTVGTTYAAVISFTSSVAGKMFLKQEDINDGKVYDVVAGENTIQLDPFEYKASMSSGNSIVFEASKMPVDAVISDFGVAMTEDFTTEAPTTTTPDADGYYKAGSWLDIEAVAPWQMWVGGDRDIRYKGEVDGFTGSFAAKFISNPYGEWQAQARVQGSAQKFGPFENGTYVATVAYTTNTDIDINFQINGKNHDISLKADESETSFTYDSETPYPDIFYNLSSVPSGTNFEMYFTFAKEDPTTEAPTSEGPTEETTEAPTTGAVPDINITSVSTKTNYNLATKTLDVHWAQFEEGAKYTSYIGEEIEADIATATNGWKFKDQTQLWFDSVPVTAGETVHVIVVAKDADGNVIARHAEDIDIPDFTPQEQETIDAIQMIKSDDNMAYGTTPIVSSRDGQKANINDKNIDSRWQADPNDDSHAVGEEFFGVDLGSAQSVASIVVMFEASYPTSFDVQTSLDGVDYTTVASGTCDGTNLAQRIKFDEVSAQYVRVVATGFSTNASTYGTSAYELGVFSYIPEPPLTPTGLAYAGTEAMPYYWTWNESEGATSYNIYVDGVYENSVTELAWNGDYLFEDAAPGTYTIGVTAVNDIGESYEATIDYTKEGPTTEAPTEETTEAPTAEPTTESGEIVMDQTFDSSVAEHNTLGGYDIFVGAFQQEKAIGGVDANNADHIKVKKDSTVGWDKWGIQITKTITGLDPNTEYTVSWTVNATNNDGALAYNFGGGDDAHQLTGGIQTFEGPRSTDGNGSMDIVFGSGQVGVANAIEYYQPIVTDSEGNIVYPKEEPTTEAPTEETTEAPTAEPTTEAPTAEPTTEAPTVEPTTEAPTTVAPTTKAPKPTTKKVKKPGRVKITKVYKKKKKSKKVKIKFKKVKGAKGYQVGVFKSSKNAKKFKKALVKKITHKTKYTIKSKKLKKKKKLYVAVRAYKVSGSKRIYGKVSKPKKVKIKK